MPKKSWPQDPSQVAEWCRRQGYHIDAFSLGDDDDDDWATQGAGPCQVDLHCLGHLPQDEGFVLIQALLSTLPSHCAGLHHWARRWATRLWRRNRAFRGLLWVSCQDQHLCVVPFLQERVDKPGVHLIAWTTGQIKPIDQQRLSKLRVGATDTNAEGLTQRLRADLDLQHVARGFFQSFRKSRVLLADSLQCRDVLSQGQRQELALLVLTRLIFLGFLEKKGLLDQDPDFLSRRLWEARRAGDDLWADFLRPLFFGVLNTPQTDRDARAQVFGDIPYLNGGLFEPTALERRLGADLTWPAEVLLKTFEVLGRYAYSAGEEARTGLDPELLGQVFEALMASEQRADSGTFFTPRLLVEELVHRAMGRLLRRVGLPEVSIEPLLTPDRAVPLPPALAAEALDKLAEVSILDPACGSGAFLLGALHALERLHRRLAKLASRSCAKGEVLRRQIIRRNLYGIDINRSALRLCELRLWLAILDATPSGASMEPLPNLDAQVLQGDALLDPMDWAQVGADLRAASELVWQTEALKCDYSKVSAGAKIALRGELEQSWRTLMQSMLLRRQERLEAQCARLTAVQKSPSLLAGQSQKLSRSARKKLEGLQGQLRELEAHFRQIAERQEAPAFSPWVFFSPVMARGGFDLILMNPPWVRLQRIPASMRTRLRDRYRVVSQGAWKAGGALRKVRGFGGQVDLSACFIERALELLAPEGVLACLVPSKLARALYGGGVRKMLMTHARLVWLREVEEGAFTGATTYPMALVAIHTPPAPGACVTLATAFHQPTSRVALWKLRLMATDLASPWLLSVLERQHVQSRCAGARLGDHASLQVRRGVMTGCNKAFLRDVTEEDAWGEMGLPLLRGENIQAWSYQTTETILWTHDHKQAAVLPVLPEAALAHLTPWVDSLIKRDGLGPKDPWWRILRTSPDVLGHKVAWKDMGKRLEAVAIPARVLYRGRLVPLIPLNTVYFLPVARADQALVLAAWLNATPVRALAATLAERARGGYRRFFAWVIAMLPMPPILARALQSEQDWLNAMQLPLMQQFLMLGSAQHKAAAPMSDAAQANLDALVEQLYKAQPQEEVRLVQNLC